MKRLQIKVVDDSSRVCFNEVRLFDFSNIDDVRAYGFLCADLSEEYPGCHLIIIEVKMTKLSKMSFWMFLNSLPVTEEDDLFFRGRYKDGSERTVYFYREFPVGEILATVGRRSEYYINLDHISEVEND